MEPQETPQLKKTPKKTTKDGWTPKKLPNPNPSDSSSTSLPPKIQGQVTRQVDPMYWTTQRVWAPNSRVHDVRSWNLSQTSEKHGCFLGKWVSRHCGKENLQCFTRCGCCCCCCCCWWLPFSVGGGKTYADLEWKNGYMYKYINIYNIYIYRVEKIYVL